MKKYDTDYSDAKDILERDGVKSLDSNSIGSDSNSFSLESAEKTIFSNLVDEIRKSLRYYVKSNNGSSNFEIFSIPLTPQDVKNSRPNLIPPI